VYQGRVGKGLLYMICLWGTFFVGMALGQWQNVYIQAGNYSYVCQFFIGLAAVPAILQHLDMGLPLLGQFQAAPSSEVMKNLLSQYGRVHEIGLLYTMVAGLLNILVVYDAYAGPVYVAEADQTDPETPSEEPDTT
jgi:uncharacterized protein DUF6677